MTVITMVVRLDLYSVVYGIFLGILVLLRRRWCYRLWPGYVVLLMILLIFQYLSCVGVPPAVCWGLYLHHYCSVIRRFLRTVPRGDVSIV